MALERNLTKGSVFGNILFFSIPYLCSYLLQTLYGMADLYIIGQFDGVAETTAVSIGSQVMHMLTVMIVGLAMGTTVFIGQAIGARHWQHGHAVYGRVAAVDGRSGAADRSHHQHHVHACRCRGGNQGLFDHLLYWHSVYYSVQCY